MKTTMKLFSLTLALILAFTCTACANDRTTPSVNLEIPSPAPSTAPAAPVEPESTEPAAPVEPEVTEPAAPVEPEVTEPAAPVEPEVTEPAAPAEPEVTEPAAPVEPEVTEPAAPVEPEVTEPAAPVEPEVTEPAAPAEPEVTEPAAPAEPEVTEPAAPAEPEATEPIPVVNEFVNTENYAYDVNTLSIKPRHVYWMDGKLVAECFVINGFSHSVYNINVKSLSFSNHAGTIAAGGFGTLKGLTLAPYQYVVWTFTFSADCVNAANADLSSLITNFSTSNWY